MRGNPWKISNGDVTHAETDISIPNLELAPGGNQCQYDSTNTIVTSQNLWSDEVGVGEGWSFTYK